MKYLCLLHLDAGRLDALSPAGKKALDRDSLAYDDELRAGGHYLASRALAAPREAAIVRIRDTGLSVTDGPFAETREQLGGFILLEARDLNEAIRLAAGIPVAKFGTVEVRPTVDIVA